MTARNIRRNSGFTLIEILIVVIILGILAAIVIPQFTNASNDARNSSLASQLQTLRSQVELYKLQHNDTLPNLTDATNGWNYLTHKTDVNGNIDPTSGVTYGPYLQAVPTNSLTNGSVVKDGTGSASVAGADFVYDYNSGSGTGKVFGTTSNSTGAISQY